jgi:hypothetical protein
LTADEGHAVSIPSQDFRLHPQKRAGVRGPLDKQKAVEGNRDSCYLDRAISYHIELLFFGRRTKAKDIKVK